LGIQAGEESGNRGKKAGVCSCKESSYKNFAAMIVAGEAKMQINP
jgi:hypothetical protein